MPVFLSPITVPSSSTKLVFQKNRTYSLIVGDVRTGDGWEINNLNITFDINKTSSNKDKTNTGTIEIYNLSKDKQRYLENDYVAAVLSVGYVDTTVKRLFAGQVTFTSTKKSGTDLITQLQIGNNYTELNHETLSKVVPEGRSVKDVVEEIRKYLPGVSRAVYNGTNINTQVVDGYPLSGTARESLDKLSRTYDLEWHVDDGVMYVNDSSGTSTDDLGTAFVISPSTGLIDLPYMVSGDSRRTKKDKAKKDGVQIRTLLNPELTCGGILKLEDVDDFDGWYKIESIRSWGEWRGNPWYSDVRLSRKIKVG